MTKIVIILLCSLWLTGCTKTKKEVYTSNCTIEKQSEIINLLAELERTKEIAKNILNWNFMTDWDWIKLNCGITILTLRRNNKLAASLFPNGSIVLIGETRSLQTDEDTKIALMITYTCRLNHLRILNAKRKTRQTITDDDTFVICHN